MERNKEEAIRAMGIAVEMIQAGNFEGAKKFAFMDQYLFPELENISQLVTVCNVHCSAKHKLYGSEMDWFGILQIDQSADEASIKNQYKNLARLLHPDKNKFDGAEAAFKLILEAYNSILRDRRQTALEQTSRPSNNNYGNESSNFTASSSHQQAQQDQTFWTVCSGCGTRYLKNIVCENRFIICPNCGTLYAARRTAAPTGTASTDLQRMEIPKIWTVCDHCGTKQQFFRGYAGCMLHCSTCGKRFIVFDMDSKVVAYPHGQKIYY